MTKSILKKGKISDNGGAITLANLLITGIGAFALWQLSWIKSDITANALKLDSIIEDNSEQDLKLVGLENIDKDLAELRADILRVEKISRTSENILTKNQYSIERLPILQEEAIQTSRLAIDAIRGAKEALDTAESISKNYNYIADQVSTSCEDLAFAVSIGKQDLIKLVFEDAPIEKGVNFNELDRQAASISYASACENFYVFIDSEQDSVDAAVVQAVANDLRDKLRVFPIIVYKKEKIPNFFNN